MRVVRSVRNGIALSFLAVIVYALAFAGAPGGADARTVSVTPAARTTQVDTWEIRSFDAEIVINPDGTVHVTETIEVTFHVASRGIYREIPFRYPVDDDNVRRLRFDQVRVSTSEGAPSDLDEERSGDYQVWRIGDPDVYIQGDHTYTLSYRVRGALNRFDTHDELFWNVTGDRWEVPIQRVSVTVRAPEAADGTPTVSDVRCFAGATGGTDPCARADHDGRTATFGHGELPPGTQLDVVVAVPPGFVDVAPPELEPANPVVRAFKVDPPRVIAAAAVTAAGLAAALLLFHRGRDKPAAPVAGALPGGVEYRPPDGLRPAQLRTLITERVDKVSLSATLVDLAVRGQVRIEETEPAKGGKPDWLLRRRSDASSEGLTDYEREVLKGLFTDGRDEVKVSKLSGSFYKHYQAVTRMLYADLVRRGFYGTEPQRVRGGALTLALLVLAVGIAGLIAVFAADLTFGLVVAPVPLIGILLLVGAQNAPRRTAVGAAMYRRALGFREFIRTAEADRMAFAERERIFADYLPYAIAFDCVGRWVEVFSRVGVAPASAMGAWYVGHGPFDADRFGTAMSGLSAQVGGAMSHLPSASGSSGFSTGGFSGGGMGGGGGGRW